MELTYSEAIYLFAELSVPDRSRLVNYDPHPSGQKISAKPLCHKMIMGALVYLVEKGYISLSIQNTKKLLFLPDKDIFAKRLKDGGSSLTGIEKILAANIEENTKLNNAVYYLLRDDETSPWGMIVRISKDSLLQKGFLKMEEKRANIFSVKKHLYGEKDRETAREVYEKAENKIKEFTAQNDMYRLSEKVIRKGVASRLEQSSDD